MKITATHTPDGFHEVTAENPENVLCLDGEPQGCRRAIIRDTDLARWSEGPAPEEPETV